MEKRKTKDIIITIILILSVVIAYQFYKNNNLNGFIRAEKNMYTSKFSRDSEITYSENRSYKIESKKNNDAMLVKEISVNPDYIYKVSCMVKTQDVKTEKENSDAGAHLSIESSTEKSKSIVGTQGWTEISLYFDAKNRETVNLGFRLGGYDGKCTGTAWFSDLKIEEVKRKEDTDWKFACFIIENIDVIVDEKEVKLSMTSTDILDMGQNIARFKNSCEELSQANMTVDYDVICIDEPLTTLSYTEENGYHVTPGDVKKLIDPYLEQKEYDHIFICVRLGDLSHLNDIEVNEWIGLRRNGLFRNWFFKYSLAK